MKKIYFFLEKLSTSKLSILVLFFSFFISNAQTTLISPSGDGGFENGSTFATNGWTNASSANNPWIVGAAVSAAPISGNSAYISNDAGVTNAYTPANNASNFFWRDVTVPAGENVIRLTFNWICQGESTYDNWQVFYAPTSVVPTGSTTHPGSGATNVPAGIAGATWLGNGNLQGTVQTTTIFLPTSLAGTTFRLIFHWKNETGGTQPPASIDNISLTSRAYGTFTSIATGNWSSPATWDANDVPTVLDDAIISTSNIVTVDATGQTIDELTVNGTLTYGVTPTSFNVVNNLTVAAGGFINVFNGTTGKTLVVSGNIVNNGTIDLSVGATTTGNLTLNGTAVQSVLGSGTFNTGVIRNLTFNNTNTSIPNINWSFNDVKIVYNLNITGAKINLNGNKIYFGNNAAGNTLTAPVGSGFINGYYSRWWTTAQTGTAITAGADPTGTTSRYPFVNSTGQDRALYVTRSSSTTTGNTAGYVTAIYNDVAGITTGLNITDGAYTITDRTNGNWMLTTESGYVYVSGTHTLVGFYTGGLLVANNTAARLMNPVATVGTFQNGSTTPGAQRIALTTAQITAEPFHIGVNTADIPFVSVATGDWNTASTWSKGTVPTCTDFVIITNGFNVTSSTSGNVCRNLTIATGGTLSNTAGDLTVGCTLNNNSLVNNGTLTVSGGTLNVRGSLNHNAGATFNQSAGDIVIDGNDAGIVANSATSYHLNLVSPVNWTGGNLTIVDPHVATTATDVLYYNSSTSSDIAPTHTMVFGNGTSTDAGGNAVGFKINTYVGSGRINFGNGIVNTGTGTNRILTAGTYSNVYRGNLTINAASEYSSTVGITVAENLTNNGTLTQTGTLSMQNYSGTTASVNTNAQTVSGSGVFRNLAVAPTANISSLTVNNSNASGVTLNVPLSVSGTLTLTSGKINTTTVNLLSLGTTTAAATLSGGSVTAYINGPFARTIASGNANTNYILFPVGKTTYAPISLAPATTAVSVMRTETFESNAGTANASIVSLATTRRWEAPLVSGTITDVNVRLGDAALVAANIPVQALTAAGEYTNAFGSIATFAAGTPNTVQSNSTVASANYTGFLSYAISNACSGTPTPGATTTTATTICLGQSVTLGITTVPTGTGITYQWQSSPDGIAYTDISGATSATYMTTPTVSMYYLCNVTCATGPATGASTPIQITFSNSVASTTPGTRCGTGTVSLSATPSAGATINWYDAATAGNLLGNGNSFATPSISTNTNYYAAAVTSTPGSVQFGTALTTAGTTNLSAFNNYRISAKYQMIYTANELSSLGLSAGNITSIAYNVSSLGSAATNANYTVKMATTALATFANTTFTTPVFTTCYGPSTYTHTASGWQTINFATPFTWDGISNVIIEVSHDGINSSASADTQYTATTGNTVLYSYNGGSNTLSTNRFNVLFSGEVACSSPRSLVTATVTSAPTLTLSGSPASICAGGTSSAVTLTAGSTDYDTYVWSPSTNVSGDSVAGWTFNPTTTTIYTLTASQSGGSLCSTTAAITITVNPVPADVVVTPATAAICSGAIQQLTTGGVSGGSVLSGSGTSTTTGNVTGAALGPNPLQNYYGGTKQQWIYTASELSTLGFSTGAKITSIKLDLPVADTAYALSNLAIKMKNSATTSFASATSWESGLTTVRNAASYTPVANLNSFTLDTPFVWDGTSNLVVEMNYSNNNGGGSGTFNTAKHSATSFVSTIFYRADNQTAVNVDTFAGSANFTYSSRNDVTFDFENTPITWAPLTDLYTDAGATIAYTGTPTTTVYAKPNADVTYTATATLGTCTKSDTSVITVTTSSSLPTEVVSACDSYTWSANGTVYNASGVYTSVTNCVTRTLDLTINTSSTLPTEVVSACDSYTWSANGTVYNASGVYTSVTNCVTRTLDLTINTSSTLPTEVVSACDSYTWSANGTVYNASGVYTSVTNCVTRTLDLTINTTSSLPTEVVSVCNTSYTWSANGTVYSIGGIYTSTTNCVTRTLDLTVVTATTPTGASTQTLNGGVAADVTIEDIVVSGTGIVWYPTALDAANDTNPITAGTVLTDNTTYYAVSENGTCRSAALAVTVTVVLGKESFDLSQLNYYPNPVKDIFNVKYNKEIISVDVYDLTGRNVINIKPNALEVQLNMTNLSSAMYIVRLQSVDGITELKVYKN